MLEWEIQITRQNKNLLHNGNKIFSQGIKTSNAENFKMYHKKDCFLFKNQDWFKICFKFWGMIKTFPSIVDCNLIIKFSDNT